MRVVKAWKHTLKRGVNFARTRGSQRQDLGVQAHGQKSPTPNGHRLSSRLASSTVQMFPLYKRVSGSSVRKSGSASVSIPVRIRAQPAQPSAGCIFKNPQTVPAGKLIDELGLKGTKRGGAMISTIHGNFIVNEGNATAKDVLELIEFVKQTAREKRGIELQTEVEIIGE